MRSPASTPRKLPTLAEVAPKWAATTAKLLELETQHEGLLAEIAASKPDWLQAVMSAPAAQLMVTRERARPEPDRLSPAAKALLGDEFTPATPAPAAPTNPALESALHYGDAGSNHLADLNVRLNGVIQAIDVLRAQLPREHAAGSRALCDAVRGEYALHAAAVCAALVSLGNAFQAHEDFRKQIVASGGNPMFLPLLNVDHTGLGGFVGDLGSPNGSALRDVLTSAAACGYYDSGAAIAEWKTPVPIGVPEPFADAEGALRKASLARQKAPRVERMAKSLRDRLRGDGGRLASAEPGIMPGNGR